MTGTQLAAHRLLPLTLALILAAASGTPLASQVDGPPAGSFLESLAVRLVEVGVLVLDRDGSPVADLRIEDFELREDGKRVKITHFEPPRTTTGVPSAEDQAPSEELAPASHGHVVLLVDNLGTDAQSRRRVLDGARQFVDRQLDSGMRFAVASYDGYLNVRQTFTDDRQALLDALAGLEQLNPLGIARRAERWAELRNRMDDLRELKELRLDPAGDSPARYMNRYTAAVRSYADRVGRETGSVFYAMSHMINALGALPGRKALVYVSEGMPMRPGEEFLQAANDTLEELSVAGGLQGTEARDASISARSAQLGTLSQRGSPSGSRRIRQGDSGPPGLEQLTALANASRVSIYALKSNSWAAGVPAEIAGPIGTLYTPDLESIRERGMLETLQVMAAQTGGEARAGGGVEALLDRARGDLDRHYVLAFAPDRPADNQYHRLEVKVKRKRVDVRARSGYIDKGLAAKLADRATTSLLLGIDDNPHGVRLELGQVRAASDPGKVEVALVVHVPLRNLVLTESAGVHSASTQLFLAARDLRGDAAPVQALGLRIETDHSLAERPDQVFSGQLPLVLRDEPQRIGLAFVDPLTGSASFVSADLELGDER